MTQTLNGTPGNDILTGTNPLDPANLDGIDIINGLAGNDTLNGLGGNDILQGGAGADTLAGGDGSDTVSYAQSTAGVTVRLLYQPDAVGVGGDAQGDRYSGIENIIGSAFDDILVGHVFAPNLPNGSSILDGGAGNDVLSGGFDPDTLIGGTGVDTATYETSVFGVTVNLGSGAASGGDAQGDTLTGIENLTGSNNANDTLIGDGGTNILDGGAGNDVLTGGAGDDRLIGRAGADQLQGGDGNDTAGYGVHVTGVQINLATGTASGAAQGDTFSSIENVSGTPVGDMLTGSAVANILVGAAGDDTLEGGAGADTLDGGDGFDTVSYGGSAAGVQVDLATGTGTGGDAQGDTLTGFEYISGSGFDDVFGASTASNYFVGGAGIDTVTYARSTAGIIIRMGSGPGAGGWAALDVFSGIENVVGSGFADILSGDGTSNRLEGGAGDDALGGGGGADALVGGAGVDTAYYDTSAAGVQVDLAAGTGSFGDAQGDTLSGIENIVGSGFNDVFGASAAANFFAGGNGTDTVSYAQSTARVIVRLNGGQALEGWAQGDTFSEETENVTGSAFDDILSGRSIDGAVNVLDGGAGNDALAGLGNADTLIGGAGIDTAYYDDSFAAVTVDLRTGTGAGGHAQGDTLTGIENLVGSTLADILRGNAGANAIDGGDGNDLINGYGGADALNGGAGIDTVYYDGSAAAVTVDLRTGTGAGGDAQGDTLTAIENIVGSALADILRGNAVANAITGGAGNDLINGYAGADLLNGGDGVDTVYYDGSATFVTVNLAAGTGLNGDAQGDALQNIENIVGSAFGDDLGGNAGSNRLEGGAGNDFLYGGAGADALIGGAGFDTARYGTSGAAVTIDLRTGTGAGGDAQGDTLTGIEIIQGSLFDDVFIESAAAHDLGGFHGNDTVSYAQSAAGIVVRLSSGDLGAGGDAQGDQLSDIRNIVGSAFADILSGDGSSNRLEGGAGDDAMAGEEGADALVGGAGIDTAYYDRSVAGVRVNLAAGTGADGDAQGDTLSGIDNLVGSALADTLRGDGVVNVLDGGAGDDVLEGRAGADTLQGGAGADTATYVQSTAGVTVDLASGVNSGGEAAGDVLQNIENLTGSAVADWLTGSAGANALSGGAGDDTLRGRAGADALDGGAGSDFANYQGSAAAVSVNLLTGATSGGDAAGDTLTGIENLYGSSNADQLTGDNGRNIIGGELGDDTLTGNGGDDSLSGEDGNDNLSGGDGADRLVGGAGVDTIHGGIGNDSVDAGSENDQVFGEAGHDNLYGGAGNDALSGGDGNDTLEGNGGGDALTGGAGIDTASYAGSAAGVSVNLATGAVSGGDAAGDTLTGIEQLMGSAFADTLTGDANANTLWGLGGGDVLTGGGGGDALKGGAGNDRFVYMAVSDSAVSGLGKDEIRDFATGDRIDLSAIDADGNPGNGNTAFTFGTGAFTGAGQLRVVTTGSVQVVYADVNGDKAPDFAINVLADHALTAADFVL